MICLLFVEYCEKLGHFLFHHLVTLAKAIKVLQHLPSAVRLRCLNVEQAGANHLPSGINYFKTAFAAFIGTEM